MPKPKNAMEIFRLLDKSNCRECGKKTCLAFAGAVFTGQASISDCPRLDAETIRRFSVEPEKDPGNGGDFEELKQRAARMDLAEAAKRSGGSFDGRKLTLKILGKDFGIDSKGEFHSEIHVNHWVAVPFLQYIISGKGKEITGNWVPFRELRDGKERYPLFQKRCEESMKKVADAYPELFDDMVHLFGGKKVAEEFESDISVVIYPLPKVPIMICYWKPEDGIESSLHIFFDESADDNLDIGAVFSLGAGLATMFEKLAIRHGVRP